MRKLISILLLAMFFLFQGGRILLYFECRFSNSITTSSCDCNQILADTRPGPAGDMIPANDHSNHKHLTEEFENLAANHLHTPISLILDKQVSSISFISSGFRPNIFHPPSH